MVRVRNKDGDRTQTRGASHPVLATIDQHSTAATIDGHSGMSAMEPRAHRNIPASSKKRYPQDLRDPRQMRPNWFWISDRAKIWTFVAHTHRVAHRFIALTHLRDP
jgi:hypothetical protein